MVTSPDRVAPIRMVGVSASVNLPLHHKVQKFSSGTGSPGSSRKKGRKTVVVVVCFCCVRLSLSMPSQETGLGNVSEIIYFVPSRMYKNSKGDEIANVNFYAVHPEATRIR